MTIFLRASVWAVPGAAILWALMPQTADAQTYPTQQIRFVVPNPPGGLPDVLSRIIADKLKDKLGQQIIVENRPGANAGIGAAAVAASKPDGYTFLVSDSAIINISHLLNAQLPFDRKQLMPITRIARAPLFLTASTRLPVKTLADVVKEAKAAPGKINYGSIGVGSFHHLSMEAVQVELGIKLNHIPYKGSGETVTALRGGQIDLVFGSFAGMSSAVKAGQGVLIAMNGAKRSADAPNVPALIETIPGLDLAVTQSLYARAGTPAYVSQRMTAAMAEVVKDPQIQERFKAMGIEADVATGAEQQRHLDSEGVRIKKIVDAAGLKPN